MAFFIAVHSSVELDHLTTELFESREEAVDYLVCKYLDSMGDSTDMTYSQVKFALRSGTWQTYNEIFMVEEKQIQQAVHCKQKEEYEESRRILDLSFLGKDMDFFESLDTLLKDCLHDSELHRPDDIDDNIDTFVKKFNLDEDEMMRVSNFIYSNIID